MFDKTDWLSPKTYDGKSTEMPIILSLYLKPLMCSQQSFIAMNSAPKDDVSIEVCFFEYQYIGALFKYIRNPVLDLLVTVSPA